ncbi:MAG: Nif3-like dinuclear metal center hexameric protein [Firmicutes bacterium]|nr:Nif3-like dinuclear metal center hexameric protein [Bacillota bacterium]
MIKTRTLLAKLAKPFPKRLAVPYHDYVGLMCGKLPETVSKVFLCLDMDASLLELVKAERPDVIITHHPFIYGTLAKVLKNDDKKKALVEQLQLLNIPVLSFHTNFDEGQGGMNDALAAALNLKDIHPLVGDAMARAGRLETPMPIEAYAKLAKKQLHVSYGLLIAKGKPIIETVAIIGGGGSSSYGIAQAEGIDLYISGDAPHHIRRNIVIDGYNYLDLPHEIEKIFMPTMREIILNIDPLMEIVTVDHEKLPKVI